MQEKYLDEFQRKTILLRSIPYYKDLSPTKVDCNKIKIVHHGIANPNRKLGNLITLMKMLDKRFTLDLYLLGDQNEISRLTRLANDSNLNMINPNSSDDARISTQTRTTLTIYEYSNP